MSRFYTFLSLMVISALSFSSQAVQIKLNIDHAERVVVKVSYSPVEIKSGENILELPDEQYGTTVSIDANSGYLITSVKDANGVTPGYGSATSHSLYVYPADNGAEYTVTTSSVEEARTAVLKVKIDNPSQAVIMTSGTNERYTFTESESEIKFIPGVETPMMISPAEYGKEFYSVTFTGQYGDEELQPSYGNYTFYPNDGSTIDIKTEFPNEIYPVTIAAAESEYITGVKLNGEALENWSSFEAKAGSKLSIATASNGYMLNSLKVNGNQISYPNNPYEMTIKGATDIVYDVRKLGKITVYVTVDDPSTIIAWKNYDSYSPIQLSSGRNTVEFDETGVPQTINFKASDTGIISQITQNGNDVTNAYSIYINEGDEFVVTSSKLVRDQKAIVYVDGKNGQGFYYMSLSRENRSEINVENGYNTVEFMDAENPFNLGFATQSGNGIVYVNDEVATPMYEGSTNYQLSFANNDVVKVFILGEPAKYNVSFNVAEGLENQLEVKKDIVTVIDKFTAAQNVHEGTLFSIKPGFEAPIVKVNGVSLESNDGVFEFTAKENSTVDISQNTAAIGEIINDGNAVDGAVYNLQGIRVADDAKAADGLPAGIYIHNGKKIIVK